MTGPAGPDHETPVPAPWGRDAVVLERLGGGYRNRVWAVRVGGHRRVARDSGASRSGPALDWELELLRELAGAGFRVPEPVPTLDGRPRGRGAGGDDLAGGGPAGRRAGLAAGRRRAGPAAPVHRRPGQRLGFASTRDLLSAERGGDMDLGRMPAEVVALCRAAWSALACTANAEVANGWTVEPDHAHRRLAELRRRLELAPGP
jgi:hypothetical protein